MSIFDDVQSLIQAKSEPPAPTERNPMRPRTVETSTPSTGREMYEHGNDFLDQVQAWTGTRGRTTERDPNLGRRPFEETKKIRDDLKSQEAAGRTAAEESGESA